MYTLRREELSPLAAQPKFYIPIERPTPHASNMNIGMTVIASPRLPSLSAPLLPPLSPVI